MNKPYYYETYKKQGDEYVVTYIVTNTDVDHDFYRKLFAERVFATSEDGLICIYTDGKPCFYHLNKEDSLLIMLKAKSTDSYPNHFDPGHA